MQFDYILIRYGEIALKGKNRYRFEDRLMQNIRNVLKDMPKVKITKTYGRIYAELNGESYETVLERLKNVFGLISFSPVKKSVLDMDVIKDVSLQILNDLTPFPKTFKVETKRPYKQFPLKTLEIMQEVGAHLLINSKNLKVDVHNPEISIHIEIREEGAFIYSKIIQGVGGMPAGTSGRGLVLLSGGIDSPVATWYAMKRGLSLEGIHFHTYPMTTEESMQKVIDLAKVISSYSGQFRVHMVPFLEIQKEIKKFAPESHNITLMRRIFFRIAERLAEKRKALALVTGESLGQVASQTLESMYAINQVVNLPIIRPLITMDKLEIIEKAQQIGTYETSIRPFEDCCSLFVPRSPATKPSVKIAKIAEDKMELDDLIERALENTKIVAFTPNSTINAEDILVTSVESFIK